MIPARGTTPAHVLVMGGYNHTGYLDFQHLCRYWPHTKQWETIQTHTTAAARTPPATQAPPTSELPHTRGTPLDAHQGYGSSLCSQLSSSYGSENGSPALPRKGRERFLPVPSAGHTATYVPKHHGILLFGGSGYGSRRNHLSWLCLEAYTWTPITWYITSSPSRPGCL